MQYRTLLFGFSCEEKGGFNAALIYIKPGGEAKNTKCIGVASPAGYRLT
jgi:hypothetical protein